jgi:hypothetical protein
MLALCLALAVPLLLTRPAAADGLYFSEGFGGTKFENELGDYTGGAFRLRLALGYRARRVAVEAFFGGDIDTGAYGQEQDLVSYGLDAKYLFAISQHIEVYLRGSMSRAHIEQYGAVDLLPDNDTLSGYAGRGLGIGTGVQLKGRAPLLTMFFWPAAVVCASTGRCKNLGPEATFAVYLDQGYDFYRLHGEGSRAGRAVDAEATRWTFGFAVGGDF